MDQKFIDKIESLRHNTYSRITAVQKDICPMVKKIYLNHQYEYWYDGYKYNVWEEDVQVFATNELPWCYDNKIHNTVFQDTLDNLVESQQIFPFLFFIDGAVIPWSKITILHDYDYTYLRCDDLATYDSSYADMIVFPLNANQIRYGEDRNVLVTPDRKGFYFGTNGYRLESTDFVDISVRFEILDNNIYYKELDLSTLDSTLTFTDLDLGFIPTLDNIILFNADGSFNHNGSEDKIEDIYNSAYNMFNILTSASDAKWAILMYNTAKVSKSASYLYDKAGDLNKKAITKLLLENDKQIETEIWDDIITPLIQTFDFDHEFNVDYKTNIQNAAKYITNYDFRLWRDAFTKNLNIRSFTYRGEDFKNLADDMGYVHFSRKHTDLIEDIVMMFVNHKLYEYSIDISYNNSLINIPIFGITNDDHVEIVMFTECNNYILDIVVPDANTSVYIHPEYNLEDCYIMSEDCPDSTYTIPDDPEGRRQFIVDLEYTVDENSNYLITFAKPEYYGTPLKVVPKKQFRYYRFKQKENQYKIILPTQFNYCHDEDRYMIFVNGKKIDKTEYAITIMNEDRPFSKLVLYLSTILDPGDYIDIFYLPEILVEKYKQEQMPTSGLILLADEEDHINYPTTYPLSKYTSMVFVNGLKVNPMDIKDVSLNAELINVDKYKRNENDQILATSPYYVDSVDNITILEYVVGDKEIAGYLEGLYEQSSGDYPNDIDFEQPASDKWKDLIQTLLTKYKEAGADYAGLQYLFGDIHELTDPAPNYKNYYAELKSILYDTVIDYYLARSEATTGDTFVYDFRRDAFAPVVKDDSKDITKIIDLVPEHHTLLDYEIATDVANPEDVAEGQQFMSAAP